MELQSFIETTLKEITNALYNSSNEMLENKVGNGIPDMKVINIDFDIAVSASTENESEIGGKITVLGIGLNISGNQGEKTSTNNLSRIKFTVPVKLKTINDKFPVIVS